MLCIFKERGFQSEMLVIKEGKRLIQIKAVKLNVAVWHHIFSLESIGLTHTSIGTRSSFQVYASHFTIEKTSIVVYWVFSYVAVGFTCYISLRK
jgi:hypothetical protein